MTQNDPPVPIAWIVTTHSGYSAVFLDHARAEKYAADSHGIIKPLYEVPLCESLPVQLQ